MAMPAPPEPSVAPVASKLRPLVSIVTPTYNEAENLPILIQRLHAALGVLPHEIIIADDNSPDGTWQVGETLATQDSTLRVMRRFHDPGLSASVLDGLSTARGEVLVVIDADLQHDTGVLPEMLSHVLSKRVDVCVGSRSTAGGGYGDWSLSCLLYTSPSPRD